MIMFFQLSVWHRNSSDKYVVKKIGESLRRILHLPQGQGGPNMDYRYAHTINICRIYFFIEHTTKHCTKLIRNDMAKITMNAEIPQVIRFDTMFYFKVLSYFEISFRIVKRSFRAKQKMDVSLKYSALYHMCNYKVTVFSNTVLIQSFYIQQ